MKKRLLPAVLLTLAAIIGFAALNQGIFAAKTQTANLVSVKGKVAVQAKGQAAWQTASERMSVSEGDMVKTAAGASVIVKLSDGRMIKGGPQIEHDRKFRTNATGRAKRQDVGARAQTQ